MRICSIEGCNKKHHGKGYCSTHHTRFLKHGDASITKNTRGEDRINNKLYSLYLGIRKRCLSPNDKSYKNYGGRGITLCDRWDGKEGFTNFLADMGPRPDGYSVGRIDNNGPYSPENCRRETRHQQTSNTRRNNKTPGVCYVNSRNRYVALITINNKTIYLGYFIKEFDAIQARKKGEIKYLGKTLK